jgi:hypothetical protein
MPARNNGALWRSRNIRRLLARKNPQSSGVIGESDGGQLSTARPPVSATPYSDLGMPLALVS